MMTPQLEEALEWVNHMRTGPLRGSPLDELPKGVPGHSHECVIARALKLEILGVRNTGVNTDHHMVDIAGMPIIRGTNPRVVQRLIRKFDAGDIRHLIDYETYSKLSPLGAPMMPQVAKPFDALLPKLANFYPELHINPGSQVEVSLSFDTQLHAVTVKNPGECPKSVAITATMVHHMQKMLEQGMEQGMEKAMHPPMMVYDPGNLDLKPGSIINEMQPMMFTALPQPSQYYAPDWAKMMQTPEAPVKAPTEELAVV